MIRPDMTTLLVICARCDRPNVAERHPGSELIEVVYPDDSADVLHKDDEWVCDDCWADLIEGEAA